MFYQKNYSLHILILFVNYLKALDNLGIKSKLLFTSGPGYRKDVEFKESIFNYDFLIIETHSNDNNYISNYRHDFLSVRDIVGRTDKSSFELLIFYINDRIGLQGYFTSDGLIFKLTGIGTSTNIHQVRGYKFG